LYTKPVDWNKVTSTRERFFYDDVYLSTQYKVNTDGSFANIVIPNQEGYKVTLDQTASFEIYSCTEVHSNQYAGQDYNNFSMEIKFTYKNVSAFIGGDAMNTSDHLIVNKVGECELYSLQHHGTAYPYTSQVLLDELTPSICVVNGITEAFDSGTRSRCELFADQIYVTGENGNIVFDCDGEHFTFRASVTE
jgi:beta-lactamase superfamily II metal-dependent hydrolase